MRCKNCGRQNPRGACYCGYCQFELKQQKKSAVPVVIGVLVAVFVIVACVILCLRSNTTRASVPRIDSTVPTKETTSIPETKNTTPVETIHVHSWMDATCQLPKTCATCGATSGTTASHQWKDATYDAPKTCMVCGTTRGSALNPLGKLSVGDRLEFGTYEQDGSSGNGAEDIEWIVLDKTADKILVISKYTLDCQRYHRQKEAVTWETCSLRTWLNSTFYNAAFSADEKPQILMTMDSETSAQDKIFLLSIDELEEYFIR